MRLGNSNTYHQLLLSVDALNTIHGGVSEAFFSMIKGEGEYLIKVRIPGVQPENVKIEVENNELSIFYYHSFDHGFAHGITRLPYIVKKVTIPFDVDISLIEAQNEDETYIIHLPFNDLAGGYKREIDLGL